MRCRSGRGRGRRPRRGRRVRRGRAGEGRARRRRRPRRPAEFGAAAREPMVEARFVGVVDSSASELLRASCHVVCAEELVQTQTDGGGISETDYNVAASSMIGRLPTNRHVCMSTTNPGAPSGWVFRRFIDGGGQPDHVACSIPASDRLTPEQIHQLAATFSGSPELKKRLVDGQWVAVPKPRSQQSACCAAAAGRCS